MAVKKKPKADKKTRKQKTLDWLAKQPITIAKKTMAGDLRDIVLDLFKHRRDSWQKMSEDEQRSAIELIEARISDAVVIAAETIAAAGRIEVKATLKQITIQDGVKISLDSSKHDKHFRELSLAQGSQVLIVLTKADDFKGQAAPAKVMPDQGDLIGPDQLAEVAKHIEENAEELPDDPALPADKKAAKKKAPKEGEI